MAEFIVCLVCALFAGAAIIGALKFWMRLEEFTDRLDYLEKDLHRLTELRAADALDRINRRKK